MFNFSKTLIDHVSSLPEEKDKGQLLSSSTHSQKQKHQQWTFERSPSPCSQSCECNTDTFKIHWLTIITQLLYWIYGCCWWCLVLVTDTFMCFHLRLTGGSLWCSRLTTPPRTATYYRNGSTNCAAPPENPQVKVLRRHPLRQVHTRARRTRLRWIFELEQDDLRELAALNHHKLQSKGLGNLLKPPAGLQSLLDWRPVLAR